MIALASTVEGVAAMLASMPAAVGAEYPSLLESLLYLAGIVFFLLLNAFFVASEFAIVKVRPSQIAAGEGEAAPVGDREAGGVEP